MDFNLNSVTSRGSHTYRRTPIQTISTRSRPPENTCRPCLPRLAIKCPHITTQPPSAPSCYSPTMDQRRRLTAVPSPPRTTKKQIALHVSQSVSFIQTSLPHQRPNSIILTNRKILAPKRHPTQSPKTSLQLPTVSNSQPRRCQSRYTPHMCLSKRKIPKDGLDMENQDRFRSLEI